LEVDGIRFATDIGGSTATFRDILEGVVPAPIASAIKRLRDIRNRTAHVPGFEPSVDDAEELLAMAVVYDLTSFATKKRQEE
jgi:hypothetical protein